MHKPVPISLYCSLIFIVWPSRSFHREEKFRFGLSWRWYASRTPLHNVVVLLHPQQTDERAIVLQEDPWEGLKKYVTDVYSYVSSEVSGIAQDLNRYITETSVDEGGESCPQ